MCGRTGKNRRARADARLARAYGAQVLALPSGQKLALALHLEGVLAEEELRATGGNDLSTEAYYDLVALATMSEKRAEQMAGARRAARLRAGLPNG